MSSKDQIPDDIKTLFVKAKDKTCRDKEFLRLAEFIISMKKVPGFNLMRLVMDDFEYTRTNYDYLQRKVRKLEMKLGQSAKTLLQDAASDDFARFVEDLWNSAKTIGTETVMKWMNRATELGYYDEDTKKVKMKEFVEDACNFYMNKRDMLETIEDQLRDLQATCAMFAELSKPQVLRIIALRSYMDFIGKVTQLAARGVPVPESIILEVKGTVNNVIMSTYQTARKVQTHD
ncbi:hypothetical protein ES703_81226 [subsurface metagenome]